MAFGSNDNSEQGFSGEDFSRVCKVNLGDEIYGKLADSCVAVAGLGGLGSVVSSNLARAGVGHFIIADFDVVEASNLNRQQYFADQIGMFKTDAAYQNLRRINPDVKIEKHCVKLAAEEIVELFAEADVIAECFDGADQKQMIVETVLAKMTGKKIVAASGMAGFGNSNAIRTKGISDKFIIAGDMETGIKPGLGLYAARVGIAANHQANAVLEILINGSLGGGGVS